MKQAAHLMIITFLTAILFSCSEYECTKADLRFGFIGFSEAEVNTIVVRRFDKTGNFNSPIDTVQLTNLYFNRRSDTLEMSGFPGNALLQSNFNYEIFIPNVNSLVRVTDIYEEQRSVRLWFTDKRGCGNYINSCKLNGQVTAINYNDVYLRK